MAHGFLSYQDTRGEVDYLGKIYRAIKDYLDKREKREQQKDAIDEKIQEVRVQEEQAALPGAETPLLKQGTTPKLPEGKPPLQRMLGGSALQRAALPGAMVTPSQAMGGPLANVGFSGRPLKPEGFVGDKIVDISATTVGVERDLGGGDMFVKRLNTIDDGLTGSGGPGGSGEVVQAIDRLTFVTMSLVAATREQTKQQMLIAQQQQQQAEYLAREAKEAAEESALEMGGLSSGSASYQRLLEAGVGGGSNRGGGPGMGIGGKVIAKNILKAATKRGGARTGTRLGAALGGKLMGGMGSKLGAKLGAQSAGKVAGGAIAKSLGKKIPLVGLGLGAVFAAQRAMQGDFLGAGLELASGAASTVPGIGTAASVGIDAGLAARDMMTPFAEGGIVSEPTNALIGEAGKEGVFPLEGSRGKKTFLKFGEGIIDAQKKHKSENSRLLAAGLSEYYDKQNGWEKFLEMLGGLFKGFNNFKFKWPWENDDDPNNPGGGGGGVGGGVNAANIAADTAEEKAFIATVRETEGTAGAQGYNTVYGGAVVPQLTQMTLRELYDAIKLGGTDAIPQRLGGGKIPFKKDQYNSSASGALQLMPDTLLNMINRKEFKWDDVFSPETQNRMILTLARNGGVNIEKIDKTQLAKANNIWAGLGPRYGQTKRTIDQSMQIYEQNLKEAKTQAPTPDPADDRRKIDSSQRISQNFGRKVGQTIAFTHNGEDYHAWKTTTGWDIFRGKGGIHGHKGRVDTSNGKNQDVVKSFLEQAAAGGGYKIEGAETSLEADLERVKSASADVPTKMSTKSTEDAIMTASAGAGTTIINNITNVQGSGGNMGGNAPADIAFGISSSSMGNNWANELALRTA